MFRTVSPSIIRSLRLYLEYQVYVVQVLWLFADKFRSYLDIARVELLKFCRIHNACSG